LSERPDNKSQPQGFCLYGELEDVLSTLSDNAAGRLFKMLFAYFNRGEKPEFPSTRSALATAWVIAAHMVDNSLRSYDGICERNRKNANKRWHPEDAEETENANGATACDRMFSHAKNANINTSMNTSTKPSTKSSMNCAVGNGSRRDAEKAPFSHPLQDDTELLHAILKKETAPLETILSEPGSPEEASVPVSQGSSVYITGSSVPISPDVARAATENVPSFLPVSPPPPPVSAEIAALNELLFQRRKECAAGTADKKNELSPIA